MNPIPYGLWVTQVLESPSLTVLVSPVHISTAAKASKSIRTNLKQIIQQFYPVWSAVSQCYLQLTIYNESSPLILFRTDLALTASWQQQLILELKHCSKYEILSCRSKTFVPSAVIICQCLLWQHKRLPLTLMMRYRLPGHRCWHRGLLFALFLYLLAIHIIW